jgi:hypothetical protein
MPQGGQRHRECLRLLSSIAENFEKSHQSATKAVIFAKEIWRLHGLPSNIVADRDTRFTSHFWQELTKHLGINLSMSTAFLSQADDQPDDWAELLPLAEHAYNASVSETTKTSLFFVNYGYQPETQWIRPAASEANFTNPSSELLLAHWKS